MVGRTSTTSFSGSWGGLRVRATGVGGGAAGGDAECVLGEEVGMSNIGESLLLGVMFPGLVEEKELDPVFFETCTRIALAFPEGQNK